MSGNDIKMKLYLCQNWGRVGTSPNGWTDDEIGFEWFKTVFVPQATERNQRATKQEEAEKRQCDQHTIDNEDLDLPPILLIYDGHGSHTTLDWIEHACENNIILYCLPPHTTHRLQPLDVGCFGPLQIAWFNRCDEILDETGEGMEMKDVVREYFVARKKAFTKQNISQAWRKSGLCPLNPDLFTGSDFAPSHRSSTNCHTPQSFPRMPHVPDLPSDDSAFDPAQFQGNTVSDSDYNDNNSECSHSNSEKSVHEESSANMESDISEDEIERQETPVARHSRANQSDHFATSSDPTSSSPPHFTRSKSTKNSTPIPSESVNPYETIRRLQRELAYSEAQRNAAEMHAVFAQCESAVWKYQFNQKKEKASGGHSRRIHTKARIVTNDEGKEEARREQERREEKKRKETAMKNQKEAKKKDDLVRRATQGSTREFTGTLSTKKKTELEDIADALGLDIQGNRKDLIARITVYFDDFPRFKEDPRFSGLFERARGRKRTNDENTQLLAPPAQRARLTNSSLDTITNTHPFYQPFPSPLPQFEAPMPVASSSQVRLEELPIPFQLVVVVLLMSNIPE